MLSLRSLLSNKKTVVNLLIFVVDRVDIPVIIMGETGCGKTKLIEFMSKLQVPTALKGKLKTMVIVKVRLEIIKCYIDKHAHAVLPM